MLQSVKILFLYFGTYKLIKMKTSILYLQLKFSSAKYFMKIQSEYD